jgi:hypothetical protein
LKVRRKKGKVEVGGEKEKGRRIEPSALLPSSFSF